MNRLSAIVFGLLLTESCFARLAPYQSFKFGQGLCRTANPAAEQALYVDNTFLIAGDQAVADGREGRVWVYTNDNGSWEYSQTLTDQFLPASPGWFGYVAKVSGDWLAVGSTHSAATNANGFEGDVQMFQRTNLTWEWRQVIRPANVWSESSIDEFGNNLGIDGDWMVVAAPYHAYGQTNDGVTDNTKTGAIWFYKLVNGVWTNTQGPLISSNTVANDNLGAMVELAGTNAYVYRNKFNNGTVVVYRRDSDTWSEAYELTPATIPAVGGMFGLGSIHQSDGDLMVTSPFRSAGATNPGAVYFFTNNAEGSWGQNLIYSPTDIGLRLFFGNSGFMKGNLAVVGVRFADNFGQITGSLQSTNALGRVYVFRKLGGQWRFYQELTATNRQPGDLFGSDVYTDGTNVYCISAGATRGSTNTMIFYSFTNGVYGASSLSAVNMLVRP